MPQEASLSLPQDAANLILSWETRTHIEANELSKIQQETENMEKDLRKTQEETKQWIDRKQELDDNITLAEGSKYEILLFLHIVYYFVDGIGMELTIELN